MDGIDVRQMPQAHGTTCWAMCSEGRAVQAAPSTATQFGGDHITDAAGEARRLPSHRPPSSSTQSRRATQAPLPRAVPTSGGQKQRLSIARAIAKDPKIYLFDDSFSALDYKTDVALRRALKAQTDNATVIIVAQRISTVLHANQILVLTRLAGRHSMPSWRPAARSIRRSPAAIEPERA